MDRFSGNNKNPSDGVKGPRRLSRRHALKALGSLSAGFIAASVHGSRRRLLAADGFVLNADDPRFAPFPGKRRLLLDGSIEPRLRSSTAFIPPPPFEKHRIHNVMDWKSGLYPNYTDSAYVNGRPFVWVACFGDGTVIQIDVLNNSSVTHQTYPGTLPLEVAYDNERSLIVVASADSTGSMMVLDMQGNILKTSPLAYFTGQGPSEGGAQGVTIDREGNYWFALSYSESSQNAGVVIKVNGNSHEIEVIVKDKGMHNPNGIITDETGSMIFALSDTGLAHQISLDGTLQRVIETIHDGYRGEIKDGFLWVSSYSQTGEMVKVDLTSEKRTEYICIPRANSVRLDHQCFVWVAGDLGLSVSTSDGELVAMTSTTCSANGLTTLGNRIFHATSSQNCTFDSNLLTQVALVNIRSLLPSITSSQAASP